MIICKKTKVTTLLFSKALWHTIIMCCVQITGCRLFRYCSSAGCKLCCSSSTSGQAATSLSALWMSWCSSASHCTQILSPTPNNHLPAFPGIRNVLCPPSCSWQVPGLVRIHLLSSVSIVQASDVHLPCCDLRVSWSTQNESKLHQVRVGGWSQTSTRWCKLRGVAECVSWLRLCRAPPGGRVRAVRALCFTTTTTLRLGLVFKITLQLHTPKIRWQGN